MAPGRTSEIVLATAFFPAGETLDALPQLAGKVPVGPYRLRIRHWVERGGTPEACWGCPKPEEGCDDAASRLKNCYPVSAGDWVSSLSQFVHRLLSTDTGRETSQHHRVQPYLLVDIDLSRRFCGPHDSPGFEVDLLPMLDHVDVT
jgi:hypothetical protein